MCVGMHVCEYYFRCVRVKSKVVCIQALMVDILSSLADMVSGHWTTITFIK